ncbi:hypothetical protein ACWCQL_13280 [Streptomyces sp. NPDC002073]
MTAATQATGGQTRPAGVAFGVVGVLGRALIVLLAALISISGTAVTPASAADNPSWHATVGPPEPIPEQFLGREVGIDRQGHYCLVREIDDQSICRDARSGELPDAPGLPICDGHTKPDPKQCSEEDLKAYEKKLLAEWRKTVDRKDPNYSKLDKYISECVDSGKTFQYCLQKGSGEYPLGGTSLLRWAEGVFSKLASDALKEAASYIGESVVWLLEQFADLFAGASTIALSQTGIGKVLGISTVLSAMLATFLLLIQFGKLSISQRGEPGATALVGLAKWAAISSVYVLATQTALSWSDAVSDWIIAYSFTGGGAGQDPAAAMKQQLGEMFGGLIAGGGGGATAGGALIAGQTVTTAAVGVIIVVGVICILAIAALWVELILRQAGIMILVATMPITLAGQLTDETSEWWPKARNGLIALILMKPAITLCFAIGFFAMAEGKGIQNVLTGLVIFLLACFAWPVLAKFMVFTTAGGGTSIASGLISSLGSSAASSSGGYRPEMGGAGAVGGGAAYTRALEGENAGVLGAGPAGGDIGKGAARGARFGGASAVAGLGLQLAAVGKDALESGMASTAAHAGLDHGAGGGRHVVIAPRRPADRELAATPEAAPPVASPDLSREEQ